MASNRQNRSHARSAGRSTGLRTLAGKLRSRRDAARHGLTAETIVDVFENAADYRRFERRMIREYHPQSRTEHELVVRLSSLLWRLRRAAAIETGLFSIQGSILRERRIVRERERKCGARLRLVRANGGRLETDKINTPPRAWDLSDLPLLESPPAERSNPMTSSQSIAQCFLRVAHLDGAILERIYRYETALWRQVRQTLAILAAQKRQSLRR